MLHETGLLVRNAKLALRVRPNGVAALVRMFQWDDKIRSYRGAAATSSGHVDRPRSASLASIRLPSRKAALPPLAPDEMVCGQQLVGAAAGGGGGALHEGCKAADCATARSES